MKKDNYCCFCHKPIKEGNDIRPLISSLGTRCCDSCNESIVIPNRVKFWFTRIPDIWVIKDKGYTKSFLTFNARATNAYKERTHLVYIANLFMNVGDKRFYCNHGVEVDDDMYALSTMVQWVWRSAIRDGKEIFIYIPSRRMRELLIDWINRVSKEGNNIAV